MSSLLLANLSELPIHVLGPLEDSIRFKYFQHGINYQNQT